MTDKQAGGKRRKIGKKSSINDKAGREPPMSSFAAYLTTYNIDPIRLSVAAGVRYLTIWNATKGIPISEEHARKILHAVVLLTGISYTGELPLLEPVTDIPTIPIKKITRS